MIFLYLYFIVALLTTIRVGYHTMKRHIQTSAYVESQGQPSYTIDIDWKNVFYCGLVFPGYWASLLAIKHHNQKVAKWQTK